MITFKKIKCPQCGQIKEVMLSKFDEYDRKFDRMSKGAKIAIGVSLGLSVADTIILLKILKKIH